MSQGQISRRYATAFFEAAKAGGQLEEVRPVIQEIGRLIEQCADFRAFLANPLLDAAPREKVLLSLFKGKVPPLVQDFLLFINFKDRLGLLDEMIKAFDGLYLQAHNRMRVVVQTALPLDETQRKNICLKLGQAYKKEVVADWQIRRDILGGFRILAGSKLYDYSFISQLEEFRQKALH